MLYVVSYDIPDDRRRLQTAKVLLDFGTRVQFSVFECVLEGDLYQQLLERLSGVIQSSEDRLRIYPLCASCTQDVVLLGEGKLTEDPDVYIV